MSDWNAPEKDITPEEVVLSRRRWLKKAGLAAAVAAAGGIGGGALWWHLTRGTDEEVLDSGQVQEADVAIYPAPQNEHFLDAGRTITEEPHTARYCNFFEFSVTKAVWQYVAGFQPLPWTLEVGGLVARPRTYDMDSLLKTFSLEERVYRHRCVETWAMVVPWTGFPLRELIRRAEPLASARYVRFVSFERPEEASRQRIASYPWPYTEGLTLAEATNELTFLATGMYGHPLLKQNGAPVRLVVPWKYGYKSCKSIVRIELTEEQPATFWNTLVPHEYDFAADVNPDVPHPRWSQRTEWMLGTGERFDTQIYNGYGEWVAQLY